MQRWQFGQIFNGIYRPAGHLPDVRAYGGNVTQQEHGGKGKGEPYHVAVNLFYGHHHHRVQEVVAYVVAQVHMQDIEHEQAHKKLLEIGHGFVQGPQELSLLGCLIP